MGLRSVVAWLFVLLGLSVAAHAGPKGIYEPKVKWSKKEISVCWGFSRTQTETFDATERSEVRKIIQQEFTFERTGIHFMGFVDCTIAPLSDVWIVTGTSSPHSEYLNTLGTRSQSDIGERGILVDRLDRGFDSKRRPTPAVVYLYVDRGPAVGGPDYLFFLKMDALHEFGHLAGLRHEHIRQEAEKDENCMYSRDQSGSIATEPIYQSTEIATNYDSNSIMNYCWDAQLRTVGSKIFYIRDFPTFVASGHGPIEEPGAKLVPGFLPNFVDQTLYTKTENYIPGVDKYDIKLGLSAGDVKAIQCMYKQDKIADILTCKREKSKIPN